jgi:hypothetical protein
VNVQFKLIYIFSKVVEDYTLYLYDNQNYTHNELYTALDKALDRSISNNGLLKYASSLRENGRVVLKRGTEKECQEYKLYTMVRIYNIYTKLFVKNVSFSFLISSIH